MVLRSAGRSPVIQDGFKIALAVILTMALSSGVMHATPPNEGSFTRLTDRAYAWVAADERSSNGALFIGETEALAVDPGLTPAIVEAFFRSARTITDLPIKTVVLTHWHPDHALGVFCMARKEYAAFSVVAHPKTRRLLAERGAGMAQATLGADSDASCTKTLPDHGVEVEEIFNLGGHPVTVTHRGAAHTPGDLVVRSDQEGVIVTGDLFMNESSPSMGEGSVLRWIEILDEMLALNPVAVIPGHFAPAASSELRRFQSYLKRLVASAQKGLSGGLNPEQIAQTTSFAEYRSFRQFPIYAATFKDNIITVAEELLARTARPGEIAGFKVTARIPTGKNPHQIAFSADGATAYVVAAGSNRIDVIDALEKRLTHSLAVGKTPLGIVPHGGHLLVSLFGSDRIVRYRLNGQAALIEESSLVTGGAPSLLVGPYPDNTWLVSVEGANRVWSLDAADFELNNNFPTGKRPFPGAATSDGRLAFVPSYDDGIVTVIDLWNGQVLASVKVGEKPSGGAVVPGDIEYAVAVRGENRIAFINTASREVVSSLSEGIGESPFSVVMHPNGRIAFVNNTGSHDISVIALKERRVVARVPVGEIPIVMAVHPDGKTLWVASEGSHDLSIVEIPRRRQEDHKPQSRPEMTEVAVMGMIHGKHAESSLWGLEQVRATITKFKPDIICAEIPPDRWERIWSDFTERGVIEDARVKRFPEYVDLILELSVQMGFTIEPCAGWTKEMADQRATRLGLFKSDKPERNAEYESRLAAVEARYEKALDAMDDPGFIHSDEYDRRMKEELSLYDEYFNDWIGAGGWTNINQAHMRNIERVIGDHPGKRILVTFGAGHKYWFLERLRERDDTHLLDIIPFLPNASKN